MFSFGASHSPGIGFRTLTGLRLSFVDSAGDNFEFETSIAKQFAAARRIGSKQQFHADGIIESAPDYLKLFPRCRALC
jgi:hypothetical protein